MRGREAASAWDCGLRAVLRDAADGGGPGGSWCGMGRQGCGRAGRRRRNGGAHGGATAARTAADRRRPDEPPKAVAKPHDGLMRHPPSPLRPQRHAGPTTHPLAASPTRTTRSTTRRTDRRVRPNRRPPPHHRHQRWPAPCVRALPPAAPARYRAARRAVAQFGSATGLGPVGRRFKSGQPDQFGVRSLNGRDSPFPNRPCALRACSLPKLVAPQRGQLHRRQLGGCSRLDAACFRRGPASLPPPCLPTAPPPPRSPAAIA